MFTRARVEMKVMEPWPEKEEEQAAAPSTRLKPVLPVPQSSKMAELDLNGKSLSLKLSVSKPPISNENFGGGGDSISSVA